MRKIDLIVIHCSATRVDRDFTEDDLEVCHRRRGFNGTGYHFYIRKNEDIKITRPVECIGAHARGFNSNSIGICYEGVWIAMGGLPTPVPSGRITQCMYSFLPCCATFLVAVSADIGI